MTTLPKRHPIITPLKQGETVTAVFSKRATENNKKNEALPFVEGFGVGGVGAEEEGTS